MARQGRSGYGRREPRAAEENAKKGGRPLKVEDFTDWPEAFDTCRERNRPITHAKLVHSFGATYSAGGMSRASPHLANPSGVAVGPFVRRKALENQWTEKLS